MRSYITELPHPYNKIGDGPEGPEVKTVAKILRKKFKGKVIVALRKTENAKVKGAKLKVPSRINRIKSYGKKILIYLDTGAVIIFSLGMTGGFQLEDGKHCHIEFKIMTCEKSGIFNILSNDESLFFRDKLRYGCMDIVENAKLQEHFKNIGPDLLSVELTLDEWLMIFTKTKKRMICDALIDQKFVSGIGWYLVNDILYESGVHPERETSSITLEEWKIIRLNSYKIIRESYAVGGHSFESFSAPDGTLGGYKSLVYKQKEDRLGNPVKKYKIEKGTLSKGRTLHVVESVQK